MHQHANFESNLLRNGAVTGTDEHMSSPIKPVIFILVCLYKGLQAYRLILYTLIHPLIHSIAFNILLKINS